MLLELALGGELFSLLQKKAPLPDKEAMFYVSQVVAIFAFMYSQKVRRRLRPQTRVASRHRPIPSQISSRHLPPYVTLVPLQPLIWKIV